ncbi:hypothetical protein [Ruficoccus sp. ZRK36]|uniref:hypothetical protein n=1 Tax=Ruficoccus sp. ZRK36 TaxID=2866311 RepID=UPI001C73401D|nr:hypothetical protein [Ruficoccus sp. ZRK36]QYY37187.1 hypothetical protein K0V07_06810 [Ruficoccus sp. ZRK36]
MQKDNKKDQFLNWHPNFRLTETLPDIKVVRTGFLVNFVAITVVLVLLAFNGYRELRIHSLNSEIGTFEQRLAEGKTQNQANLKLSSEFTRQAKLIDDVRAFHITSVPPVEFLRVITATRPDDIAFQSVRYELVQPPLKKKEKLVKSKFRSRYTVTGMLKGSSAEALIALNSYRARLSSLEILEGKIEEIQVSQPRRNPSLDLFEFEITLTLLPEA